MLETQKTAICYKVAKYSFILLIFLLACESSSDNSPSNAWRGSVEIFQKPNGIEAYNSSTQTLYYALILKSEFDQKKDTFKGTESDTLGLRGSIREENSVILNRFLFNFGDSLRFIYWDKTYSDPNKLEWIDFKLI